MPWSEQTPAQKLRPSRRDVVPGAVLAAVLLVDVVLLALGTAHRAGWVTLGDSPWQANGDASWFEWFRTAQLAVAGAALMVAVRGRDRAAVLVVWTVVLAVVVADATLGLHSSGGSALVRMLGLPRALGLGPQDAGELIIWGLIGGVLGSVVLGAHRRSGAWARRTSLHVGLGVGVIAVSAVGTDLLHSVLAGLGASTRENYALAVLESGGESLGAALVLAVAIAAARAPLPPATPDGDLVADRDEARLDV